MGKFRLLPYPGLDHPDLSIGCKVVSSGSTSLLLEYVVIGAIGRLRIPGEASSERRDGLWQHTCFEAFLGTAAGGYAELNFSPSRQWAAYRFSAYREGMIPDPDFAPPEIEVEAGPERFVLSAAVRLPSGRAFGRMALSAVIEEREGGKSYWALAHPPGKPDFHHPACFAAELPAPSGA